MTKLRFFLGCFLGFVGIALLLRLTEPKTAPKPYRPFVRPQTWHLSGWKLVEGKQLPWELWGRAEPPLSYERIGESVEWMDSSQKVVRTPSLPGYAPVRLIRLKPGANNHLVFLQNWGSEPLDPETQLPVSYRIQAKQRLEGELRAEYNVALPKGITTPPSFTGPTLDLQAAFVPSRSSFIGKGISLLVTLLTEDQEGNLRVQVDVHPGTKHATAPLQTPYTLAKLALAGAIYSPPPPPMDNSRGSFGFGAGATPITPLVFDDHKESYILRYLSGSTPPSRYTLRLIRVSPRTPQAPRPKQLTIPLWAELRWSPAFLPYFRENLLSRVRATLPLKVPSSLPQDVSSVAQRQKDAETRGWYYHQLPYGALSDKKAKLVLRKKVEYWFKQAGKPAPKAWG